MMQMMIDGCIDGLFMIINIVLFDELLDVFEVFCLLIDQCKVIIDLK